jgi:hypothetical protein
MRSQSSMDLGCTQGSFEDCTLICTLAISTCTLYSTHTNSNISKALEKGPDKGSPTVSSPARGAKDPEVRTPVLRGFLLVLDSYGSLISLPVRHAFDSHPTLPYIATVLLIPRGVGIIHICVGVS